MLKTKRSPVIRQKIPKQYWSHWKGFLDSLDALEEFIKAALKEPNKFFLAPLFVSNRFTGLPTIIVHLFLGGEDFSRIHCYNQLSIRPNSKVGRVIALYREIFDKSLFPAALFFDCWNYDEELLPHWKYLAHDPPSFRFNRS